ncbi:MAG: glycosyltransferase family 39 protein [Dehalococcoidia bacterium]
MVSRLRLNWEIASYILLALIALGMRLWALDARAFHYDESLHAFYSWKLYAGQGYQHMPMMHGPFQFHGTALSFLLFGDSDFTARLLPALFGTALVVLPYFLRRHLGRWGSLAVATLLAFSPTLLYYSR